MLFETKEDLKYKYKENSQEREKEAETSWLMKPFNSHTPTLLIVS